MTKTPTPKFKVGDRVRANEPGTTMLGTVVRQVGMPRVGGGYHYRVNWDNGSSHVHRQDRIVLA
jgi:hypothetical protein